MNNTDSTENANENKAVTAGEMTTCQVRLPTAKCVLARLHRQQSARTRLRHTDVTSTYIYMSHKRETSNVLYALVRSEQKCFQMLSKRISANSKISNYSSEKFHTPNQLQRKPVGQWCLAGNVEQPLFGSRVVMTCLLTR